MTAAPVCHPATSQLTTWATRLVVGLAALAVIGVLALTVGPRLLPYQTYIVVSGSMAPTIPTGALIVLQPVASDQLAVGEIITFQHPERPADLVTHRIVAIEEGPSGRSLVTQGDANVLPDSWRVVGRGQGWRYLFAIPQLGALFQVLQAPLGRLVVLIVPAVVLGVLTLVDIWRPAGTPRPAE